MKHSHRPRTPGAPSSGKSGKSASQKRRAFSFAAKGESHSGFKSASSFGSKRRPSSGFSSRPNEGGFAPKGASSGGSGVASTHKSGGKRSHGNFIMKNEPVFIPKGEGRFAPKTFKPKEGDKKRRFGEKPAFGKKPSQSGKPYAGKNPFGKLAFGSKPSFGGKRRDESSLRHEKPEPIVRGAEKPRDGVLLWGLHAARAAYLNPKRRCFRIWLSETGQAAFANTITEANENLLKRPDAKKTDRNELDRLTPPGSVHQGIVIEVAPLHEPPLHEIIAGDNPPDLLLMLDQVTDPHNVGAILRSAAAFGTGAVIMTERNAPVMTGVQAKSASGATEHVHQIHVVNLARAIDDLQQAGYWCVGLAEEGTKDISQLDLSGRTVLVMGAEGEGLRQLTRKKCDELARLPTGGPIGSLNVSNAAAVALYEVRRQKGKF